MALYKKLKIFKNNNYLKKKKKKKKRKEEEEEGWLSHPIGWFRVGHRSNHPQGPKPINK
jgi:hypothetical protein